MTPMVRSSKRIGARIIDSSRSSSVPGMVSARGSLAASGRYSARAVLRDPARDALADPDPELLPELPHVLAHVASPGDRDDVGTLHPVDTHVVVVDELAQLGADRLARSRSRSSGGRDASRASGSRPAARPTPRAGPRAPAGRHPGRQLPPSASDETRPGRRTTAADPLVSAPAARNERRSPVANRRSPRSLMRTQRRRPWSAQARTVLGWTPRSRAAPATVSIAFGAWFWMAGSPADCEVLSGTDRIGRARRPPWEQSTHG